jgi:pimeloyl-ACP methyl ester carboxylesterase
LPLFAPFRIFAAALSMLAAVMPASAGPEATAAISSDHAVSNIVVGFVGGFVRHDNPHHGPVQLARRIQLTSKDTYVQVFENRHRSEAHSTILRVLDTNHDGILSAEEKKRARIVLFGHSWGGAAVVLLARDLHRDGIPVLLTVQVDSVAKLWQNDGVIPDNVGAAVNFYQPHGLIHGRSHITAADPVRTEILGNYLADYRKNPVECLGTSWYDRYFTPSHAQSECDPHVWSQIENMVRSHLQPQVATAAANPRP